MEGKTVVIEGRPELGKGKVEEIVDGIAYLTMSNGVEMEFDVELLRDPPAPSHINENWFRAFITKDTEELAKLYHENVTLLIHPKQPSWQKMKVDGKTAIIAKLAGTDSQKLYQMLTTRQKLPSQIYEAISRKLIETGNKVRLEKAKRQEMQEAA